MKVNYDSQLSEHCIGISDTFLSQDAAAEPVQNLSPSSEGSISLELVYSQSPMRHHSLEKAIPIPSSMVSH
jgi:hypothetical protein